MNIVRKMALHPWLEEARQVNGVAKEDHTLWVPLILASNSTAQLGKTTQVPLIPTSPLTSLRATPHAWHPHARVRDRYDEHHHHRYYHYNHVQVREKYASGPQGIQLVCTHC